MAIKSAIKIEKSYPLAEPVRIGVIGCGAIAQGAHLPIIQDSESETLHAVCDIKPLLAKKVGQRYGAAKIYSRIDDILKDQEIEAVIIATNHDDHSKLAIDALRRGKHVLVEKPMAMKSADAIKMVKMAKQSNRHLMVGYMWRHDRGTESALQKLQDGSLGEINFALAGGEEGIHGWEAGALRHIFRSDEKTPKPVLRRPLWCNDPFVNFAYEFLMDCGSHTVDLLRMFLGEPKEICYTDVYRMDKTRDTFHPLRILSVLKFENCTVYYNIAYLDHDITGMSVKMRSDRGSLEIFWNPTLLRNKPARVLYNDFRSGHYTEENLESSWCFEREHESFIRCIRDQTYEPPSSADKIYPVNLIGEAMMESWIKKSPITLSMEGVKI